MTRRTFVDSSGRTWEVHEVKRTASAAQAVRPGLESGWLSFASGNTKRRLGKFPPTWETMPDAALSDLCQQALEVKYRDVADVATADSLRELLKEYPKG